MQKFTCVAECMAGGDALLTMESTVHGYHVNIYQNIWNSMVGSVAVKTIVNIYDMHAVAIIKPDTGVVDHLPRL